MLLLRCYYHKYRIFVILYYANLNWLAKMCKCYIVSEQMVALRTLLIFNQYNKLRLSKNNCYLNNTVLGIDECSPAQFRLVSG